MEKTAKEIINFIRSFFKKANRHQAILGLSGGLDSSLTCLFCSQAFSPQNVFPLYLPYLPSHPSRPSLSSKALAKESSPSLPSHPFHPNLPSVALAKEGLPQNIQKLLSLTQIPLKNLISEDISPQINIFQKNHPKISKIDLGNKMARERMSLLYYYARQLKGLVVGTSNLSETLLGYFTLHGDGAWDLAPLAHLYKTEVIKLAQYLKIPQEIINQPPTAGLWPNQTDEKELGFSYEVADKILSHISPHTLFTIHNTSTPTIAPPKVPDVPPKLVRQVLKRVSANAFKLRNVPFSATLLKKSK